MADEDVFDPRGLLSALHRNYVNYVLIGGLARVIRGTDEITSGVDVCPSLRPDNLERLGKALEELEARRTDRRRLTVDEETLAGDPVIRLRTSTGELKLKVRSSVLAVPRLRSNVRAPLRTSMVTSFENYRVRKRRRT